MRRGQRAEFTEAGSGAGVYQISATTPGMEAKMSVVTSRPSEADPGDEAGDGYRRLASALRSLVREQSADAVLERIASDLREVVHCDDVVIWELVRERLTATHVDGEEEEATIGFEIEVGQGITGSAVLEQEAIVSNNAHLDTRAGQIPGTEPTPEAVVCIPLTARGTPLGALSLYRRGLNRSFAGSEVGLIEHFASVAAIALHNAKIVHELERLAATDDLTGLSNRRHFHEELERHTAAAQRHQLPLSLLLLDLDNFKQINDQHGHLRGDDVLRAIAAVLTTRVRVSDVVGRLGGDEFAILLPHTTRDEAGTVAADLAVGLEEALDLPFRVGVSIGLASCPELGCEGLLMQADSQLYVQKRKRAVA